jgi:drug/metabolite transporter (DMT)-like permease
MRPFLLTLLAVHAAVSAWALQGDFLAPFPPFKERTEYQVFFDLLVATLVIFLLVRSELLRRKRSTRGAWVMLAGAALVGSFSPLVYLLVERDLFRTPRSPDAT